MLRVILFFILSINIYSYEIWDEAVRNHISEFESLHPDPFIHALKGSCKEDNAKIKAKRYNGTNLKIPFYPFLEKDIPAFVNLSKDKKAPAIFLIPGSFGKANGQQPNRMTKTLLDAGLSVVRLPNPYSTQFMKAEANFWPGDFMSEANVLYHAIKESYRFIKSQGHDPSKVIVSGVSQGAFMSSIIMDLDDRDKGIIDNAILFSPPFDMGESIRLMDKHITDSKFMYAWVPLVAYSKTVFKLCRYSTPLKVSEQTKSISKFLVAWTGFQEPFADSIRLYSKRKEIEDLAPRGRKWMGYGRSYRSWMKTFRFSQYMKRYAPEVDILMNSRESSLMYWVDRVNEFRPGAIRIVSAEDDFINAPGVWNHETYREELILLPNGSHYGYRATKWFDGLLVKMLRSILKQPSFADHLL